MKKKEPLNQVREFETLPRCLDYMEKEYKEKPALTFYREDGTEITRNYREFTRDVRTCMRALKRAGLDGKHVALISENRYEWVVIFWAVTCLGGVLAAIDVEQPEEEIAEMVSYADARAVFLSDAFLPVMKEWLSGRRRVIILGESGEEESFQDFLELSEDYADGNLRHLPEPEDRALLVYTSGTTSTAKPVVLSHRNLLSNAAGAMAMVCVGERIFTPLPLYHTYSLTCGMLGCLSQGLHFSANGYLKTMMRDIRRFEADTLLSVPMITDSLLRAIWNLQEREGTRQETEQLLEKERKRRKWRLRHRTVRDGHVPEILGPRLRRIISGGAHMNEKTAEELELYGISVLQGYGITECSPLISVNRNHSSRRKSVGTLIPGMEIKFTGGEILVKGPSVFQGYYKNESLTREVLVHGWFHTGDIGYMDKQGYLYICGRKKSLIVFSNGKKVVPEELEQQLVRLPYIREVIVYGARSGQTEDDVTLSAMIYPDREKTAGMSSFEVLEKIQDEISELNRTLPFYKRIQSLKLTETEFVKTGIQKIRRKEGSL